MTTTLHQAATTMPCHWYQRRHANNRKWEWRRKRMTVIQVIRITNCWWWWLCMILTMLIQMSVLQTLPLHINMYAIAWQSMTAYADATRRTQFVWPPLDDDAYTSWYWCTYTWRNYNDTTMPSTSVIRWVLETSCQIVHTRPSPLQVTHTNV